MIISIFLIKYSILYFRSNIVYTGPIYIYVCVFIWGGAGGLGEGVIQEPENYGSCSVQI